MSESQVWKCPKCGGEMQSGYAPRDFRILKSGDFYGDAVFALYCTKCGYVELYKERSTKEVSQEQRAQQQPSAREQQKERETPPPSEATKGRLVR